MNTQSLIALATLVTLSLAGTTAMADGITVVNDTFTSTKTRAEVKAEVLQARAAGVLQFSTEMLSHGDAPMRSAPAMASTLTREQVRAQLRKSPRGQAPEVNAGA